MHASDMADSENGHGGVIKGHILAEDDGFIYRQFDITSQKEIKDISNLIDKHLLEPYSIYVYWYFINTWPRYCFVIEAKEAPGVIIGVIISKVEPHREVRMRGYIGMLVIEPAYRGKHLATNLVKLSINKMIEWDNVDEVTLETEVINESALRLYESLGFVRTKRLFRYYLNTHDAYRLILPISDKSGQRVAFLPPLSATQTSAVV